MKHLLVFLLLIVCPKGFFLNIDSAEIERERIIWNRKLTEDTTYKFNKEPNGLLIESVKHVKPGFALDIGMGQGRNTIYLAQQGWKVTGIDIADEAMKQALQTAAAQNIKITTIRAPMQTFDFGVSKWDLIVWVYEGCFDENDSRKIKNSLRKGGRLVFEFFHREAGIEMNRLNLVAKVDT